MISEDPEVVEAGFQVVKTQIVTEVGRIDVLGTDAIGRLVIMELKVDQDDSALLQGLRYYDWAIRNYESIVHTYPKAWMSGGGSIRLLLVAPGFSDGLVRACYYVEPRPELFRFSVARCKDGERGLLLERVRIPASRRSMASNPTLAQHAEYIASKSLREAFLEAIDAAKSLVKGSIQVDPRSSYVSVKYKGRVLGEFWPLRGGFYVDVPGAGLDGQYETLTYEDERLTDHEELMETLKKRLEMLAHGREAGALPRKLRERDTSSDPSSG